MTDDLLELAIAPTGGRELSTYPGLRCCRARFGGEHTCTKFCGVEAVERRRACFPVFEGGEQSVVDDDRPAPGVPLFLGVALIPRQNRDRPVLLAQIRVYAGSQRPQ